MTWAPCPHGVRTRGKDNYFCPWYEAGAMEHCLVIFGAGSVGGCLFLAYRPDEEVWNLAI